MYECGHCVISLSLGKMKVCYFLHSALDIEHLNVRLSMCEITFSREKAKNPI